MTPMHFLRASAGSFLMFFLSCNPSSDQVKDSARKEQIPAGADTATPQKPLQSQVSLPKFKITQAFLAKLIMENPDVKNASKFIFQPKFYYGFSQPEGMMLYLFPAKNHGDYARGKTPIEVTETDGSQLINIEGIAFGNMEMNWKEIKRFYWQGNEPDANFSHILLTPDLTAFKQLRYKLQIFDKNNTELMPFDQNGKMLTINFDLNPSPPAEPSN